MKNGEAVYIRNGFIRDCFGEWHNLIKLDCIYINTKYQICRFDGDVCKSMTEPFPTQEQAQEYLDRLMHFSMVPDWKYDKE